jgi:hypothetical protein
MRKYLRDIVWALSILGFVACCFMAFSKWSMPYFIASAVLCVVWIFFSITNHNDNENYFIEKKERMKL